MKWAARLASWKGSLVWFTERLKAGGETSFAQQSFRLNPRGVRAAGGVHVQARWGHDLMLRASAITKLEFGDGTLSATEKLGDGVTRISRFTLVALKNEQRTGPADAAHVILNDGIGIPALSPKQELVVPAFSPETLATLPKAVSDRPVIFWVGSTLREQAAFWRACDAIVRDKIELNAWFCGPSRNDDPSLGVAQPEELASFFGHAFPMSQKAIEFFASRARAVSAGKPITARAFAGWPASRSWALKVPADLAALSAPNPRRISKFDARLLRQFRKWSTPLDRVSRAIDEWSWLLQRLPEELLLARLEQWARLERGRFLASRAGGLPERPWGRSAYQLTEAGRGLL